MAVQGQRRTEGGQEFTKASAADVALVTIAAAHVTADLFIIDQIANNLDFIAQNPEAAVVAASVGAMVGYSVNALVQSKDMILESFGKLVGSVPQKSPEEKRKERMDNKMREIDHLRRPLDR
tara:strand:+ start:742 stop:1107 length:366 start_codon:yes stop_codon:yes gene_type:complete